MSIRVPKIELITSRPKLIAGRDQTVDVLIRLTPPEPELSDRSRPRLNLSLVLDRSGSMDGEKIVRAREAVSYCIDQLLPTDRASVVIFDDEIEVLVPSQLVKDKAVTKERLAHVFARNSTALHTAWVRGGMQVSEHLDEGAINRVLLVTDGLANVGVTNTDEIVSQAAGLHSRGVSTSTIGIGADFNEDLLIPMAQSAGGNSWHVERPEDMQRIFSVELEGLVAQFAHTVSLGFVPADGVRLVDLLNDFELNETGRYRLPDFLAGAPLDIVVQLNVPAQGVGAKLRLLDLKLGFTPQDSKSAEVVKEALDIEFDTEDAVMRLPLNHEVAKANALLMNARARKEAIRYMDRGDRVQAQGVLVAAMSAIDAMPSIASAPEMRADADSLADLRASLADPSQDKVNRKRLSYGAFLRQRGKAKP